MDTAERLGRKIITRDYVYTLVKNNRFDILLKVKSKLGIIEVCALPENNLFESDPLGSSEEVLLECY